MRSTSEVGVIEDVGFPIGLFDFVSYKEKEMFSENRLINLLNKNRSSNISDILTEMDSEITKWNGNSCFNDDISVIAVEFK